jgi:fibro-slime domain-containing protein
MSAGAEAQLGTDEVITTLEEQGFNSVADENEFKLYGVIRDFNEDHPDFGISNGAGSGHYVGNVSFFADASHKPVFIGGGKQLQSDFTNRDGRPIAPHLFDFSGYNPFPQGSGVYSTGEIDLGQGTYIDAYNSSIGPYSVSQNNDGIVALQATDPGAVDFSQDGTINATLLVGPGGDPDAIIGGSGTGGVTGETDNLALAPDPLQTIPPVDMPPSVGDVTINSNIVIDSDLHTDALTISDNAIVTIVGDVTIQSDGMFNLGHKAEIQLAPNSTLDIFTMSDVRAISQEAKINANTQDPTLVTFYHLGGTLFTVSQYTEIHATIYAPGAEVRISQNAEVFGRVLAERTELTQGGAIHIDQHLVPPVTSCGTVISDSPGTYHGPHDGLIQDVFSFRQWFRNSPGQNVAEVNRLPMTSDGSGVFEHIVDDLTIADAMLPEGSASGGTHNRYWTYEATAVGQYQMCSGQFFEFTGSGDAWLMINDKLVLDMGGLAVGRTQIAELDRMGFADGELFTFRFFYAQRSGGKQPFSMRTNINFVYSDAEMPDSSGLYD